MHPKRLSAARSVFLRPEQPFIYGTVITQQTFAAGAPDRIGAARNGAAIHPIESTHSTQPSFRACWSYEGRHDHPPRRRAPPVRAQGVRLRPQAVRKSRLLREKRMPRFLAEFACGALKHNTAQPPVVFRARLEWRPVSREGSRRSQSHQ